MKTLITFIVSLSSIVSYSQINPANITIARDSFGVPHIYGRSDGSVRFGLMYAQAEDNFWQLEPFAMIGSDGSSGHPRKY